MIWIINEISRCAVIAANGYILYNDANRQLFAYVEINGWNLTKYTQTAP